MCRVTHPCVPVFLHSAVWCSKGTDTLEDGSISSILILVILIAIHGGMELSYAALTNTRRTALKERADEGDSSANRTLQLSGDLSRLYITAQLFVTLMKFAIVAIATVFLAEPLIEARAAAGDQIVPELGYLAVLLPVALVTYILGDLIPSAVGVTYADQLAPIVTIPTRVIMLIFSPLVTVLRSLSNTVSHVTGGEVIAKAVTEEEILSLVEVGQRGGTIEDEEREMIYSVLQFGETLAREVMVPRPDLTAVDIETPLTEAVTTLLESGHSRIPVYEEDIDNIKGLLYAKDLLRLWNNGEAAQKTVRDLIRPAYFVPETKRADMLFKEMQERKVHLAVIVDEYGGTAGIVTIEDLVEEIVGDIKDEYDFNEEAEYVKLSENEYLVDGGMNLDDLNELLDVELPTDENDSIGGYVYSQLGHVPEIGETIEEPALLMRVEAVENRRIRKVYIARRQQPTAAEADEKSEASANEKSQARSFTERFNPSAQPKAAS